MPAWPSFTVKTVLSTAKGRCLTCQCPSRQKHVALQHEGSLKGCLGLYSSECGMNAASSNDVRGVVYLAGCMSLLRTVRPAGSALAKTRSHRQVGQGVHCTSNGKDFHVRSYEMVDSSV